MQDRNPTPSLARQFYYFLIAQHFGAKIDYWFLHTMGTGVGDGTTSDSKDNIRLKNKKIRFIFGKSNVVHNFGI